MRETAGARGGMRDLPDRRSEVRDRRRSLPVELGPRVGRPPKVHRGEIGEDPWSPHSLSDSSIVGNGAFAQSANRLGRSPHSRRYGRAFARTLTIARMARSATIAKTRAPRMIRSRRPRAASSSRFPGSGRRRRSRTDAEAAPGALALITRPLATSSSGAARTLATRIIVTPFFSKGSPNTLFSESLRDWEAPPQESEGSRLMALTARSAFAW